MTDVPLDIPEGYEILKTIEVSDSVSEYIARYKSDDAPVRLRLFNFSKTSGATTRRHLREYLRSDITFMEELSHPGLIHVFDYSDTKNMFWIATQPAEAEKLSKRIDFLGSQSFEFRQGLVRQFLAALQHIHNSQVLHRNLSSETVFLSSEMEMYIGDFGFAAYFTESPTALYDTVMVTTKAYQPPEVRDAETFIGDAGCDIFAAGLLVFEILSATVLPKDNPEQIYNVLHTCLNEQVARETINPNISEVILRASDPLPERRWPSAEDLANAIERSFQEESSYGQMQFGQTSTIAIAQTPDLSETTPVQSNIDATEKISQAEQSPPEETDKITPLDKSHEIWNNRYEITGKIGEGGQAIVYKAYDHLTNEEIAIKTIWSKHRGDRAAINRLKQGAMIARSLTHRYIIKTYSVEQRIDAEGLGKYVFICMELIKSQLELSDVIESRRTAGKKFNLNEVLHITRQLLDALAYAHEYTIHRDIKPGNIMLVQRNDQEEIDTSDLTKFDIRLIDFGIAKVLSQKHIDVTGKGFRSAHYGAPELADAKIGVDARADLFSAGVIMYQMLTKNIPRKGSLPVNKVNKDVPAALAKVIDKSISTEREKRFKTVSEFTKEINRAVSKFNWVRKAAKIAAVLIVGICIAGAIKYFLPEPDRLPVQKSIESLQNREPGKKIVALAKEKTVNYSDIEGYTSYDNLRVKTLGALKEFQLGGIDTFIRTYPVWKDQEKEWSTIEPAVKKIESIAKDKQNFDTRKNLPIAEHLVQLEPSAQLVSEAKTNAQQAEKLLDDRPILKHNIDICADSYDLAAKVYTNIDRLADGSDALETAVQINSRLKNVEKLREDFLPTYATLNMLEQLRSYDFHERSEKCLDTANKHYKSFALKSAEQHFTLLNQICGTMIYVRDEIDFDRSDIGLITSRLMELCNEDIDTFENYPEWKERLEQVYERKDIIARYKSIRTLLIKGPQDAPVKIYNLAKSAKQFYEQDNLNEARSELVDAAEKYKTFMRQKINQLIRDCNFLLTLSTISTESIEASKNSFTNLLTSLDRPDWQAGVFIDEYNIYSEKVISEKNIWREQMIQRAMDLQDNIINFTNVAQQQSFFWKSKLINSYTTIAQGYNSDEIHASITNWEHVEDLSRISNIVAQMDKLSSRLEMMLTRKEDLDNLAEGIDEAVEFCKEFKGISAEEKEQYKQWALDLKQIKSRLTKTTDNIPFIDQNEQLYTAEYTSAKSDFLEIRAKLPFHSRRVIELINKTNSLEKTAANIIKIQEQWAFVLGKLELPQMKTDFNKMRLYLEDIKDEVDKWASDVFNQDMQDKCKDVDDQINKQDQAVNVIISAILDGKSSVNKNIESLEQKVNTILSDPDISTLNSLAKAGKQQALLRFRQLPTLLSTNKQKISNIVLNSNSNSIGAMQENDLTIFQVDTWLKDYNKKENQLNIQISQLATAEDTISVFQETDIILSQQLSIESDYYIALRDYTINLIDYSDVENIIHSVESDSIVINMCKFLEQMENTSVPNLSGLKNSFATIKTELTNLKSIQISTLSHAKDFNNKREQLLTDVSGLRGQVSKLDRPNLENICKQSITDAVKTIKILVGKADEIDRLKEITTALWSFFPDHKDWPHWAAFLELYHIAVSDEDVSLASFEVLRPVNEKGQYLSLSDISASAEQVFILNINEPVNFGWPRYISHQKEPTIVFAFIPSSKPFYMAVREINNAQYKLFMEETGAKSTTKLAGWAYFSDSTGSNLLIGQAQGQFPPSRITWDESAGLFVIEENFENAPVTWVTASGAQAYAQWLDAKLPTPLEHAHATRSDTATAYPWGNDLSNISSYAHVRSLAWQNAAREYNRTRDNPVEIAYPPVGAIKDFVRADALEPSKTAHLGDDQQSVWPCFTESAPNTWGLYDMIGNVWEWCLDMENISAPVICGGSCLSPPEYVAPDSKYEFKAQACDVGFRIVIHMR